MPVSGGGAPYTAISSDDEIVTVAVEDNNITLTGVKEGKAVVIINDKNQLSGQVVVEVKANSDLTFDKSAVEISVDDETVVTVENGTAPYTVAVEDDAIATATIEDDAITIKGIKAGSTILTITDKDDKTGTITVSVK